MKLVNWLARLVLAGTFFYAGLVKAPASAEFAVSLAPFTFLPPEIITPLALVLPLTEIVFAILILFPFTARIGAAGILLLCAVFLTALGWALANDVVVDCACFGLDSTPTPGKMLAAMGRDAVLAVLATVVVFQPRRSSIR